MLAGEAAVRRSSAKYVFLKISQYSQESTLLESLCNTIVVLQSCNYIKK